MTIRTVILTITSASLVACATQGYEITQPTTLTRDPHTHMNEDVRKTIDTVVVVPHTDQARIPISWTLYGISQSGSGPVVTEFLIPYIILPVFLYGATKQAILNQIQEMRDELADQLTRSAGRPVSNTVLAQDLYSRLHRVPGLDANIIEETASLPEGTDAVLLVRLTEIVVEVMENEAEIVTSASAMLRRASDGRVLYSREYSYLDRDTLRNWIDDDAALWQDYMNFARHYVARQVTADFFEKIELRHDLYPAATNSVTQQNGDHWSGQARTSTPELAWEYVRLGDDTYPPSSVAFGEGDTFYDLEIYDRHRLVYVARYIPDPIHTVEQPLPGCRELRWTVRPSFYAGNVVRFGEWMRHYTNVYLNEGYVGTEASETPAFTRGFAVLTIPCETT
jgi:hypothetical protein